MKAIVTDDSKATRMILRRLLEDLRFEVQEAPDGASLIQFLQEIPELEVGVDADVVQVRNCGCVRFETRQVHPLTPM